MGVSAAESELNNSSTFAQVVIVSYKLVAILI